MNFKAFPSYEKFDPQVPVCCVTPGHAGAIHRFFDTSPISPDGRYLAACILPYADHLPIPRDRAEILLVNLETGQEEVIAHTEGWGIQVGANLQWGDDQTLYYNDLYPGTWEPCLVQLNPFTGEKRRMKNGIFMLSPDGRYALTHNLVKGRLTQNGYGVMIPDEKVIRNGHYPEDDGFYRTDTRTGESILFMPLARLIDAGIRRPEQYLKGEFYGFQCKWSPNQKRIMYVVRWLSHEGMPRRNMVFTSDEKGENIHLALHDIEWGKGGHHVNWHPDSEHITMNLRMNSNHLRFISFSYDGSEFHTLTDHIYGSGHPTIHKGGRFLLTDAYYGGDTHYSRPDGCTPIRLVDLQKKEEKTLLWMKTNTGLQSDFRLDPHPAWSYDWKYVAFNGFDGDQRRVYVCDLSGII